VFFKAGPFGLQTRSQFVPSTAHLAVLSHRERCFALSLNLGIPDAKSRLQKGDEHRQDGRMIDGAAISALP
jgi:hypothetical protein